MASHSQISHSPFHRRLETQQINFYVDALLDVLFLIDKILMFFTTYFNKKGFEIKEHYLIFINYTRTWRFLFDTLSILGSYVFTSINPSFKYF